MPGDSEPRYCENCGRTLTKLRRDARYCDSTCRSLASRRRRKLIRPGTRPPTSYAVFVRGARMRLTLAGVVTAHDREAAVRSIAPQSRAERFVVIPTRSLAEYAADGSRV